MRSVLLALCFICSLPAVFSATSTDTASAAYYSSSSSCDSQQCLDAVNAQQQCTPEGSDNSESVEPQVIACLCLLGVEEYWDKLAACTCDSEGEPKSGQELKVFYCNESEASGLASATHPSDPISSTESFLNSEPTDGTLVGLIAHADSALTNTGTLTLTELPLESILIELPQTDPSSSMDASSVIELVHLSSLPASSITPRSEHTSSSTPTRSSSEHTSSTSVTAFSSETTSSTTSGNKGSRLVVASPICILALLFM
ncbi:hypothetical protein G9P44_001979 [Scheffersomyces stipitis]|nr:hypothetical protein G9P44_001979 [Scheffersomyces stipitis]